MDINERIKMLEAMDFIVRHFNDERAIDSWLSCGLPDGTVEAGTIGDYVDDHDTFADIMDSFVYVMAKFCHSNKEDREATIYCDGVASKLY